MTLMLALVAQLVTAQPQLAVEASPAFGLSLRPAWGGLTGVSASWNGFEAAALVGYQVEPYDVFEPYLQGAQVTGATHRLQTLATVGAKLELWRFTLGAHVMFGLSNVWLRGTFVDERWNVRGILAEQVAAFTGGLGASVAFRVTDTLHVRARVLGPLPWASGVTGYCTFSLGLGWAL